MTTDDHVRGSERSHRKMSDEEFDREKAEMKEQLSVLMKLLQESDEDQRCGWEFEEEGQVTSCATICKKVKT